MLDSRTMVKAAPFSMGTARKGIAMNTLITDAIQNRLVLEIDYPPGRRKIEPHAHGESKDGNELLRAFQTEGASESGEHVNWKLFRVDRIQQLVETGETFSGPRPGYKRGDSAMKGGIFAEL